ncbi:MAG: hypothetical protein ACI9TH_004488 [Kiritimatiellia bacterium]|jgi:hypothetical protein
MNSKILYASALFLGSTLASFGSLVAHYEFEETEPSDGAGQVLDSAGSQNGSTVLGGGITQGVSGKFGNAYAFTAGGVDVGSAASVQPSDNFTISFWLNLSAANPFDRFLESQSGNGNAQHGIRLDSAGSGNHFRALIRSGAAGNTQVEHSTIITPGNWYFAAARYDTANTGNELRVTLLADGAAIGAGAITTATQAAATFVTGAIDSPHARSTLIGMEVPGGNTNSLRGSLDDFAFFDQALSDQELANAFNLGAVNVAIPEPSTAGLLLMGAALLVARLRR